VEIIKKALYLYFTQGSKAMKHVYNNQTAMLEKSTELKNSVLSSCFLVRQKPNQRPHSTHSICCHSGRSEEFR